MMVEALTSRFLFDFAATDAPTVWPPTPRARMALPVTTLIDMPPEMLMEIVQRVGDARALSAGECEGGKKTRHLGVFFEKKTHTSTSRPF